MLTPSSDWTILAQARRTNNYFFDNLKNIGGLDMSLHSYVKQYAKPGVDLLDRDSEDYQSKKDRINFEASHEFKVGDRVMYAGVLNIKKTRLQQDMAKYSDPYAVGEVMRTKTTAGTGCCIAVRFQGVHLNFWNPSIELIRFTPVAKLLYG